MSLSAEITNILFQRWYFAQENFLLYRSTYLTLSSVTTIVEVLAWGILFYAIFNPKISAAEVDLPSAKKASVPRKIKVRDGVIGFFGWLIIGNVVFALIFLLLISVDWDILIPLVSSIIWLSAIIVSSILYLKRRIWLLTGVLAAFIINGISWLPVFKSLTRKLPSFNELFTLMGVPLPAGVVLFFIGQ